MWIVPTAMTCVLNKIDLRPQRDVVILGGLCAPAEMLCGGQAGEGLEFPDHVWLVGVAVLDRDACQLGCRARDERAVGGPESTQPAEFLGCHADLDLEQLDEPPVAESRFVGEYVYRRLVTAARERMHCAGNMIGYGFVIAQVVEQDRFDDAEAVAVDVASHNCPRRLSASIPHRAPRSTCVSASSAGDTPRSARAPPILKWMPTMSVCSRASMSNGLVYGPDTTDPESRCCPSLFSTHTAASRRLTTSSTVPAGSIRSAGWVGPSVRHHT